MTISDIRQSPNLAKRKIDKLESKVLKQRRRIDFKDSQLLHLRAEKKKLQLELKKYQNMEFEKKKALDMEAQNKLLEIAFLSLLPYYPYLTLNALKTHCRKRELVEPRQIVGSLLAGYGNGLSLSAIGKLLGYRDHSTIIHSKRQVEDLSYSNKAFRENLRQIRLNFTKSYEALCKDISG